MMTNDLPSQEVTIDVTVKSPTPMEHIYFNAPYIPLFKSRRGESELDMSYDNWKLIKFKYNDVYRAIDSEVDQAKNDLARMAMEAKGEANKQTASLSWYHTSYKEANTGQTYGNGVYATSEDHAKEIILKRGLGEELSMGWMLRKERGWMLPSEALEKWWVDYWSNPKFRSADGWYFDKTKLTAAQAREMAELQEKAIHGATFVGFLALKSGVATVDEILSDCGITHHAVHLCAGTFGQDEEALMLGEYNHALPMMKEIEARVPGLIK